MFFSKSLRISDKTKTRWIGRTELLGGRQSMAVNQKEPEILRRSTQPSIYKLHSMVNKNNLQHVGSVSSGQQRKVHQ